MTSPTDHTAEQLRLTKQAIRKQVLMARGRVDAAERARLSAIITTRLLTVPELQRARCVLAYLSFGHELDTGGLITELQERGTVLALPRIDRAAHRLELYRVEDPAQHTLPGVWGIREPDPDRCERVDLSEIDAVVVPGVAFTPSGDRLGYGGGYYDELLSRWQQAPPLLAAAFDLQIVDRLPTGPRDRAVDAVVTQSATYRRPQA